MKVSGLRDDDWELRDSAAAVMALAYNPHSGWHVGAAVRTQDGRIFCGAFFEHATMGLTICAEVAAFIAANMAGARDIQAIAIAGAPGDQVGSVPCTPCGRCRQTISEFAALRGSPIRVICSNRDGSRVFVTTSDALLPHAFGGDSSAES